MCVARGGDEGVLDVSCRHGVCLLAVPTHPTTHPPTHPYPALTPVTPPLTCLACRVDSPELRAALAAEAAVLASLARLEPEQLTFVGGGSDEADGAASSGEGDSSGRIELVVGEGVQVWLPMAGLFDAAKETERLQKQAAKIEKELAALNGRLGNAKFMDKAPEKVVAEARAAAAEMQEQLAAIAEKLAKFAS